MARCAFCERKAVHELEREGRSVLNLCEACGKAYREGFEHGKVFESVRRRMAGKAAGRGSK